MAYGYAPDALRTHARITAISEPFNNGWVQLTICFIGTEESDGECAWRIWATRGDHYYVGQELCGMFYPAPDMPDVVRPSWP